MGLGCSWRNLTEKMEDADCMASQSDSRSRRDQELIVAERDRDPEDRCVASGDIAAIREKMMDKTLADSYLVTGKFSSSMVRIASEWGRGIGDVHLS